ncbi:cysteine--tRNA ligase [Candidatus Woesearchaeota archaeon]|nr:cysteine--tRNA ligase [Candidatus Woesearchaeota archaeon]
MMALQFYNTLARKKEEFKPINKGKVGIYACGPTVYNYAHIGNFRAYIFNDLLRRFLIWKGYQVNFVMNITDVDDKTIRDSRAQEKSLKEFTDFYTEEFFKDMQTLNILKADIHPRATDHIKEIQEIISKLKKNKHTYEKDGNIYFAINSMPDYGLLANLNWEELKENAQGRLESDEYEKDDARDFALWKAYSEDDGDVYWQGDCCTKGRPGWHIECSAMSTKYLGQPFDIHCGGVDLIFPHHTNEIAQSEGANKKKLANYWLHNEHLLVDGKKMSKSLGNFYTLRDLLDKGLKPFAIRYELLATHYRQQLNFTIEGVKAADQAIQRLQDFILRLKKADGHDYNVEQLVEVTRKNFESALEDDLNISNALAVLFDFVKQVNVELEAGSISKDNSKFLLDFLASLDCVLGIMTFEDDKIPKHIEQLVRQREQTRKSKDFKEADKIRDQVKEEGYVIEDGADGPVIKKI